MKKLNNLIFVVALSLMSVGCALTTEKININYQARANITVVEGASKSTLKLLPEDLRTVYKDRVGTKKNGYGMEMASIVAANDVSQTFSNAVQSELEGMGFTIGEDGKTVKIQLVRFYNDFKTGFFAGDSVADGLVNVVVSNKKKEQIFSKSYEGGYILKNIQLATGENAREALTKAMTDIVTKIAQDKDLHLALLKD